MRYYWRMADYIDRVLVTVQEAAEIAGCSQATIKSSIKDGRIVGEKIGRQWLVDSSSLRGLRIYRPWERKKENPTPTL